MPLSPGDRRGYDGRVIDASLAELDAQTTRVRAVAWLAILLATACTPPSSALPDARSSSKQARARAYCEHASDCTIVARTCCGHCGAPAPGDAVALHAAWAREHLPWRRCHDTGCPRCHADPDPRLIATCRDHRCRVVDLSRHRITRCTDDADCTLRAASCACSGAGFVAIRADAEESFRRLVCDPDVPACTAHEPPPPTLHARCVERTCVAIPGPGVLSQ